MGLIRRSAFIKIGGWNQECITEDAEASLRMLGAGYRGVYDPTAYGEGLMPLDFDGLKKQRFRWALVVCRLNNMVECGGASDHRCGVAAD